MKHEGGITVNLPTELLCVCRFTSCVTHTNMHSPHIQSHSAGVCFEGHRGDE